MSDDESIPHQMNLMSEIHKRDLQISRYLNKTRSKPLREAWFVQGDGQWVRWKYHEELGKQILEPLPKWKVDELDDLFPEINNQ